jgi:mono/diheme cytochrome c family protein
MRPLATAIILASLLATGAMAVTAVAEQSQNPAQPRWQRWGMSPWPMGRGMMGGGMMGPGNSSMPRHHLAMMWGVPAPYTRLTNPLPETKATVDRGAKVYSQSCAPCHGVSGQGDGEAGRQLSPPPGNLAWLSQMPMVRQDAFMYWTVAEGGAPLGSAMPSFKMTLPKEDIWAVIAYVQARLPQQPPKP